MFNQRFLVYISGGSKNQDQINYYHIKKKKTNKIMKSKRILLLNLKDFTSP